MEKNKTQKTLMSRLKKATINPVVMGAIAGISYFAGIKQNTNSNSSFESMREAMGGEITHMTLEGAKGSNVEYFSEGDLNRVFMKDKNGIETRVAFDTKTGDGVLWSSSGVTMRTESGQWVEGDLTDAQHAILNGVYDSYLERQEAPLTKGQEAVVNGTFENYLKGQGR